MALSGNLVTSYHSNVHKHMSTLTTVCILTHQDSMATFLWHHSTTCSHSSSSPWNWLCKAWLHLLLLVLTLLTMASWNSSRLGSKTAIIGWWSKNWHVQWEMPLGGARQQVCNMGSYRTLVDCTLGQKQDIYFVIMEGYCTIVIRIEMTYSVHNHSRLKEACTYFWHL